MRLRGLALLAATLGCAAKPVFVQLDISGPSQARAEFREIGAVTDLSPVQCTTPCRLEFSPKGVFEIELQADGYYPVLLAVEYGTMLQHQRAEGVDEPRLVLPMLPRN